jgi:hypothetical protein
MFSVAEAHLDLYCLVPSQYGRTIYSTAVTDFVLRRCSDANSGGRALRRRSSAARLLRISDWNPAVGMDVSSECCVLLGRGLCEGPILCPGVLPNVCGCVVECDQMQQ